MSKIKKIVGVGALTLASTITLASCAPNSTTTDAAQLAPEFDPNTPVEIVFESYNLGNAAWKGPILDLVADFEAEYPNVTVITQESGDTAAGATAASVQRQVLAGDPPDVVQMTFDTLGYAASDLQAQPLGQLFGEEAIEAHFEGEYPMHENVRNLGVVNGEMYGLPYVLSTPIFYYNATALESAGITDPDFSTWDGVAEAAAAMTAVTGTPSFSNSCVDPVGEWCYQSMVRSAGGNVLSEDRSTIEFGETAAVAPLIEMQAMFNDGVMQNADFNGQYEAFAAGTTQMHINSASMQAAFQAGAAAGGWELAAAAMPGFADQTVVPTSSGSMLSIFTTDPLKQAAAWEFTKFMTSETAYQTITPGIGYLPLRDSMTAASGPLADWAAEQAGLLTPNLEQLDRMEGWVAYPGKNYMQIATILMDAAQEVVYSDADPETTMTDAAERAQELVEQ